MPADASQVQRYAGIICQSIHETRDLRPFNDTNALRARSICINKEKHFAAQTEIVQYLWQNGITHLDKRDVHGNTALHYLAGCRAVNQELLDWWFKIGGLNVADHWHNSYNEQGTTPGQMEAAGKEVRTTRADALESQLERYYSDERARKKEKIWRDLLQI
jgi:hypothetical protein